MSKEKNLFIIAGPNGAGKTTSSLSLLRQFSINVYVNADDIAKDLSPFKRESVAFQAGRLMLDRIHTLLNNNQSFGIETTLATLTYQRLIKQAQNQGYKASLIFIWLESIELAIERVRTRVEAGGHNIPKEIIIRRYQSGLKYFFQLYKPIVDRWVLMNNSTIPASRIAEKLFKRNIQIENEYIWQEIVGKYQED